MNLSVNIGSIHFKNPILVASGTFGYGEEYAGLININKLGGIVTKAITLKPREGNPPPRIVETPCGMINSIGLANVGIEKFLKEKMLFLQKFKTPIIVNIAGENKNEYIKLTERLSETEGISGLEINISCPNVKRGGLAFGANPQIAFAIISAIRKKTKLPLIAKLTPQVTSIVPIAKACEDAGTDGLSLINTLPAMAIDVVTRRPKLGNITGGLSGPAIKPVALYFVWQTFQSVKIPIIGIGGIMNLQDTLEFLLAGATAVQIGTGLFVDPKIPEKILLGLREYCRGKKIDNLRKIVGTLITQIGADYLR
ncbi:MAG: dihydroorotate dehydrogenase [Candidatus Edwardsbacteria bacterium]